MKDQLPFELVEFLKSGKQLDYDPEGLEVGRVLLFPWEEVKRIEFKVVTSCNDDWEQDDPHREDNGYYAVPAYDLVKSCRHYSPQGILIYLPSMDAFGQHDDDHQTITYFPQLTWPRLVAEPHLYLNGQWEPESPRYNPKLNPIGRFPFRLE